MFSAILAPLSQTVKLQEMAQLESAEDFGKISRGEWVIKEEKHDCDNYDWALRLMQQITARK